MPGSPTSTESSLGDNQHVIQYAHAHGSPHTESTCSSGYSRFDGHENAWLDRDSTLESNDHDHEEPQKGQAWETTHNITPFNRDDFDQLVQEFVAK